MRHHTPSLQLTAIVAVSLTLTFSTSRPAGERVGGVHGTIRFLGPEPAAQMIDLTTESACAEVHGDTQIESRPVMVDESGGLQNAVVYVREGLTEGNFPEPSAPVLLDQLGCLYTPPVVAMRAGQTLVVRNSDATLHNVHVFAEKNRGFNIGQPLKGMESKRTFANAEVGIEVKCDIHGWMEASIGVFDHPFFVVTGNDGRFSLEGLPPGDYVIEVHHARLGTTSLAVTIADGESTQLDLTFSGSPS